MRTEEIDPILEGLTIDQLKDTIVRLVQDINQAKADAKDYAKASREIVKQKEERIEECLYLISQKNG